MLFNSFTFMIFLPVVFLLYWFVFKRLKWQNLLILVASYVFYGWWDWRFLILIVITSLSSYVSGLLIKRYEGQRGRQKAVSAANIVLNLGILATFKYFNFFVGSMGALLHTLGMEVDWPTMRIILPVGISFYTFQALSYSIDVYTRKIEPTKDIIAFFSFISFFPQLVAGPIEGPRAYCRRYCVSASLTTVRRSTACARCCGDCSRNSSSPTPVPRWSTKRGTASAASRA